MWESALFQHVARVHPGCRVLANHPLQLSYVTNEGYEVLRDLFQRIQGPPRSSFCINTNCAQFLWKLYITNPQRKPLESCTRNQ